MTKLAEDMEEFIDEQAIQEKQPTMNELIKKDNATLQNVYDTVGKYLFISDYNRIDIVLATALSNQMPGSPLWIFIVGSSGDWKTTFVRSLEILPNVRKIDQMTTKTLATGKRNAQDLGSELNDKSTILLIPDTASLTSMNKDSKGEIWGQFRNLYDGVIYKDTGEGVRKKYENCHVTLIACSTDVLKNEILLHSALGTRELIYNTNADRQDNNAKMDAAWENERYQETMLKDMQKIVYNFIQCHKINHDLKIPSDIKTFIKQEATRLSILRAGQYTDKYTNEIINDVVAEVPTRATIQFKRLYLALKSLTENYPDEKCKTIIQHIVNSTGNEIRQKIIETMNTEDWEFIDEIRARLKIGRAAIKGQLEILWNLGVLDMITEERRVGGWTYTDPITGVESSRGGRVETISLYRRNPLLVLAGSTHTIPKNNLQQSLSD